MASEFTLKQARYLVSAVDHGTMASAARQLHVSPSAVSLAVSALEEALGAALLIRAPHRPLALTITGQTVLGDLRRLLASSDDLVNNARREAQLPAGRLRVGCFRTLAPTFVPPLVAAISDSYPTIKLEVDELSLVELQEALLDGRLEVGLLYDLDIRPEIDTEVLTLTKPHVLLGKDHPLSHRKKVHLRDLSDDPMILLDVPPSKNYFQAILDEYDIEPAHVRTTGSLETLRSLVARNQGWSMLIQRPTISVSYEGLPIHLIEIADSLQPMSVVAAWPAGTRLTRRAELFLQLSREVVSKPRS